MLGQRLRENNPAQEILGMVREEILATTKLPMAIDFMAAELRHLGAFSTAMERLTHYFTPFQCFVMSEAENDMRRFDLRVGLEILAREAAYRAEGATRQGLFLYQLEVLSRNRLGYDAGLEAVARDPAYDESWRNWILTVRRQIGIVDLADLIFVRSEFYHERQGGGARRLAPATRRRWRPRRRRRASRRCLAGRRAASPGPTAARTRCCCSPPCTGSWAIPKPPSREPEDPEQRLLPSLARRRRAAREPAEAGRRGAARRDQSGTVLRRESETAGVAKIAESEG